MGTTLINREGLERYLPHRDEVAQLDKIIWLSDCVHYTLASRKVRDDEWWVSGHIPSKPVLPAILMVESAAQLATYLYTQILEAECPDYVREHGYNFVALARIDNTRFRINFEPGDEMTLLCKKIRFTPRTGVVAMVQGIKEGKLAFETRMTGVPIPIEKITPDNSPATHGEDVDLVASSSKQ